MDKLQSGKDYLRYRLKAMSAHGIHSPFVFELYNDLIADQTPYYGYEIIESLRAKHLMDHREIEVNDFGAKKGNRKEKISAIARKSVKPAKYAQLLFRIANYFKPKNILELGTSFGISTLYLSMPDTNSSVITLEGSPEIAEIAKQNFDRLKCTNIELLTGEFDTTLPQALNKFTGLDLVYFDGNHRLTPTLSYFEKCLPLANANSIFIFDDIHWSKEMNEAWKIIKSHSSVSISIDLFQFGIIFFRKVIKQHFIIKY